MEQEEKNIKEDIVIKQDAKVDNQDKLLSMVKDGSHKKRHIGRYLIGALAMLLIIAMMGFAVHYYNLQTGFLSIKSFSFEPYQAFHGLDRIDEDVILLSGDKGFVISLSYLEENFDVRFFVDRDYNRIIYSDIFRVIRIPFHGRHFEENHKVIQRDINIIEHNDKFYISIDLLRDVLGYTYSYNPLSGRLDLYHGDMNIPMVISQKSTLIKEGNSFMTPNLGALMEGEKAYIIGEDVDFLKIRTYSGIEGYVSLKDVEVISFELVGAKQGTVPIRDQKIIMAWDFVTSNNYLTKNVGDYRGLNVISPTWFSLGENLSIIDLGRQDYINQARAKGYEVWPMVDNSYNPARTSLLLNDSMKREKFILELLALVDKYSLTGLNIDFENVYYEDKDVFTQFMRELVPPMREKGVIISIDVTRISTSPTWSMFYDRAEIAKIVDYICLMAYDEYWASSPISGPVASLPWVEAGIFELLPLIEPERIILGVPLYTRRWREHVENGNTITRSFANDLEYIYELIELHKAEIVYDDELGLNYADYFSGGYKFRIWLEDAKAMENKVSLVAKYNLAGIAAWRLGFELPEIWDVIDSTMMHR